MIFIYTSHFKRMFLRLLHVFRYSNQHTSGISLNNWNSFLQRCMYMYIIYAWFLFSLLARIDSWHIPTPHQLNFHNDLAAIMYPSLQIFFYGEGENFWFKKNRRGIHYIAATDDPVRFKGDGGGWRFITEVQGSDSVVQSSFVTRADTVQWLQDGLFPDKLLFDIIGLCLQLFVCFRCAFIIYMYFCYLISLHMCFSQDECLDIWYNYIVYVYN